MGGTLMEIVPNKALSLSLSLSLSTLNLKVRRNEPATWTEEHGWDVDEEGMSVLGLGFRD